MENKFKLPLKPHVTRRNLIRCFHEHSEFQKSDLCNYFSNKSMTS